MTYIPTKEELEELGFKDSSYDFHNNHFTIFKSKRFDYWQSQIVIDFKKGGVIYELYISDQDEDFQQSTRLNIQSLDDIRTLIRLLTPQ